MRYALFLGCTVQRHVNQYDLAARAVLDRVGIEVLDVRDFNCCGYPMRNMDQQAFLLLSAKNLALAENHGLNIMTLCKCCFGSLKKANHLLKNDSGLRDSINLLLEKENLHYQGSIDVRHFLTVLSEDIGTRALKEKVSRSFADLNIATHYGCHALRPSDILQFDDPIAPVIFDQLVEVTGAKSIDWEMKLECCGAPLMGVNDKLSADLAVKKLKNGRESGADYICVGCPWCHVQFDTVQEQASSLNNGNQTLPGILYPQLLGLALGIHEKALGLDVNKIDINKITGFFTKESEESQE